jgi:hypothetical protein
VHGIYIFSIANFNFISNCRHSKEIPYVSMDSKKFHMSAWKVKKFHVSMESKKLHVSTMLTWNFFTFHTDVWNFLLSMLTYGISLLSMLTYGISLLSCLT